MITQTVNDLYKLCVTNLMAQQFLFGSTASAATTFTTRGKPQDKHQTNAFIHRHLYARTDYANTYRTARRQKM